MLATNLTSPRVVGHPTPRCVHIVGISATVVRDHPPSSGDVKPVRRYDGLKSLKAFGAMAAGFAVGGEYRGVMACAGIDGACCGSSERWRKNVER
jgi:hypothetical protein